MPNLQVLYRRLPLRITRAIKPNVLLLHRFIRLKSLHLLRIHHIDHIIRLPFLKCKHHSTVTIVLIVGLVFTMLHIDEVGLALQGSEILQIKIEVQKGDDMKDLDNFARNNII